MDQVKIGKFIATCRKQVNLTQSQLAEKLNITDRAVSKWENGRAMPDSSLMLDLCKILKISVNDLLNGEVVDMENNSQKQEELILELVKAKEEADKRLLRLEVLIGVIAVILLLGSCIAAAYIEVEDWIRAILIIAGFLVSIPLFIVSIRIEQVAGYYECKHCEHKYVPTYKDVTFAMHYGRTRYLKCPKCNKKSCSKKVISK